MTKINIKYNKTIDPIFITHFKSFPKWKDSPIPETEKVIKHVELYKKEWEKHEEIIFKSVYEKLGLGFKRNIIDVNIVSRSIQPIANPLVISSGLKMDEFLFCLTHELMHVLYRDNEDSYQKIFKTLREYSEDIGVVNHLMIYPFLEYIFNDVLNKPEELAHEREKSSGHTNDIYKNTWNIIDKIGYKKIIEIIKKEVVR